MQTALETGSALWDEEEHSLGTVHSVENIWEWLQGPVLDLIYTDRNARCSGTLQHSGKKLWLVVDAIVVLKLLEARLTCVWNRGQLFQARV